MENQHMMALPDGEDLCRATVSRIERLTELDREDEVPDAAWALVQRYDFDSGVYTGPDGNQGNLPWEIARQVHNWLWADRLAEAVSLVEALLGVIDRVDGAVLDGDGDPLCWSCGRPFGHDRGCRAKSIRRRATAFVQGDTGEVPDAD